MALSANTDLARLVNEFGATHSYPVAQVHIYRMAAVGLNVSTGYVGPLATTTYTKFIGFAAQECDNSSTASPAGVAGAGNGPIEIYDLEGEEFVLAVSGVAVTDAGKPIYASADNTFTLTQTSATPLIGYVTGYDSSGYARVRIKPWRREYGSVTVELLNTAATSAVHTLTFPFTAQIVGVRRNYLTAWTLSTGAKSGDFRVSGGLGVLVSAAKMSAAVGAVTITGSGNVLISANTRLFICERGPVAAGRGPSVTIDYLKVQRL